MCVCLSVPHVCLSVCLSHMCVSVCLSHMPVFLTILQYLYLPPPKGEQKAAGGGPLASIYNNLYAISGKILPQRAMQRQAVCSVEKFGLA